MIGLAAHRTLWDNLSERGAGGTMGRWPKKALILMSAVALLGCSDLEILPGERQSVRSILNDAGQVRREAPLGPTAIDLPKATRSASWSHRIGTPKYRTTHAALNPEFSLQWSAPIGEGDSRRHRINADPVAAQDRVFTLDAHALVTATSSEGQTLWTYDLTPARDGVGDAGGGGLAFGENKLFVTSGYGTLTALDPKTGLPVWVHDLNAGGTGTPSVYDGVVYVVAGDGTAVALEADTGRMRWEVDAATSSAAGVDGGAAPAVTNKFVVFALASGEIFSVFRKGGLRYWSNLMSGKRVGVAAATINDVTSDPVVVDDTVYVGSHSGRLVALDISSGKRRWTLQEGALGPVWPVGGSLFFVSDNNKLMRVRAKDGRIVWSVDLPYFTKYNPKRSVRIFAHYGPVLAGGQLVIASDDGLLRLFDPVSGALLRSLPIPDGATTSPILVDGTMYIVSGKGELHAFR